MKSRHAVVVALAGGALVLAAPALAEEDHVLLEAEAITYAAGPGSLPEGAEFTVLYGDPGEDGLFAMRLKLPDGYHIPPHAHGRPEIVTVLEGTFHIGMGDEADREAATALAPGSFFAFPPGMAHFAYTEGETVVQLNSSGPWTLDYVDPADDPRMN